MSCKHYSTSGFDVKWLFFLLLSVFVTDNLSSLTDSTEHDAFTTTPFWKSLSTEVLLTGLWIIVSEPWLDNSELTSDFMASDSSGEFSVVCKSPFTESVFTSLSFPVSAFSSFELSVVVSCHAGSIGAVLGVCGNCFLKVKYQPINIWYHWKWNIRVDENKFQNTCVTDKVNLQSVILWTWR